MAGPPAAALAFAASTCRSTTVTMATANSPAARNASTTHRIGLDSAIARLGIANAVVCLRDRRAERDHLEVVDGDGRERQRGDPQVRPLGGRSPVIGEGERDRPAV